MRSARISAIFLLVVAGVFNEWAFRFIFPLEPIDSFLRLITLILDCFLLIIFLTFVLSNRSLSDRSRELQRSHPRKLALFLGFFLSFCLFVGLEFACRHYFKHHYHAPYREHTEWQPKAYEYDPILGTRPTLDTTVQQRYTVNDTLIFDQAYRIDKFGRRMTPSAYQDSTYTDFVAVTGCSFAFGYALDERSTLGFFLDSLLHHRAYNYGFYGYGTQQTLALLQHRNLRKEMNEPNGIMVHLFIDDHISRLIGSRRMMKLWAPDFPYYRLVGDELRYEGSFLTGRHWLTEFYRAISESAIIDLFDIDIPWYVSDAHLDLFAAVISRSQEAFIEQFPEGRFILVIGPNSNLAPRMITRLERRVEVIDCSKLLDKNEKRYKIHWTEAHPNAHYYFQIADSLRNYLNGKPRPAAL